MAASAALFRLKMSTRSATRDSRIAATVTGGQLDSSTADADSSASTAFAKMADAPPAFTRSAALWRTRAACTSSQKRRSSSFPLAWQCFTRFDSAPAPIASSSDATAVVFRSSSTERTPRDTRARASAISFNGAGGNGRSGHRQWPLLLRLLLMLPQ
eukprot:2126552-Prymnesium_polylepis.1